MTNEQTLADAITMIRILVAHGHEPLPRDLLARASNFLERFPYELPSKPDAEFLSLVGHCSNCSCQDCREFFKADARARVEPKCATCGATFVRIGDGYAPICVCSSKAAVQVEPRAHRLFEPKEAGSSWCKHCNLLRDEHDPGICPAVNRPAEGM